MKNNNLNVSIIFPGPFHFHYLFPINGDFAEHNSADKEVDGTADGNEEMNGGCVQDRCYAFMKRKASSVSIHKVEKASTQTLTGTYGWQRGKEDGGNRHGEPTPPGIHVQVLPKMSHACLGSCEPHKPFHDNRQDFTARRLERSIVEKQELEREIFIHSKTIPQPPTPPHTTDTVGKKKEPF